MVICKFDENEVEYKSCERPVCNHTECPEHEEFAKIDWIESLEVTDIPLNCTVSISVRDNILDDEDYPIASLLFEAGVVVAQVTRLNTKVPAYPLPDLKGKGIADLVVWVNKNKDNDENQFPQCWNVASKDLDLF
jgi:hypothetical protein